MSDTESTVLTVIDFIGIVLTVGVIAFLFGIHAVVTDCKNMGAFYHMGKVYDCVERENIKPSTSFWRSKP